MTLEQGDKDITLLRAYRAIDRLERQLRAAERAGRQPLAIIGMGCRFPGDVDGPESLWRMLVQGRSGISRVPAERWDVDAFYDPAPHRPGKACTDSGGFIDVDAFDPAFFGISPAEARALDPQQRVFLEVAWEALEDAAVSADDLAGSRTGVFVGVASSEHTLLLSRDPMDVEATLCVGTAHSVIPGRLSYLLDLRGPSVALDTACSSSLAALHFAARALRNRDCDLAIVGGVNAILSPLTTICASRMGILSPDGQCHTFDGRANGFVRSEGCGVVVLRRLDDAVERRDPIWACLRGSSLNQDGRSVGLTAPNGSAQIDVMRNALADGDVARSDVGFLEAHGTGTPLGDSIELDSIRSVFAGDSSRTRPLVLGAVKTNLGHLEAAAGMAGLIKAVLAVARGTIPANHGFQRPNWQTPIDPGDLRIATENLPWSDVTASRIAGVSAFGISGTNAHVVLEEPPSPQRPGDSRPLQLLLLSARTPRALLHSTRRLAEFLERHPEVPLADVAHTLRVGRAELSVRVSLCCASREEAIASLRDDALLQQRLSTVDGREVPLAFLFAGVGEQYPGMAAELYAHEPAFRRTVDTCCERLEGLLGLDLREVLFAPQSAQSRPGADAGIDFAAMVGRTPAASPLDRTRIAQPVLFVIEIALARLLVAWGIRPAAVVGHSIGEYAAATLAGIFSLETALDLVARRAIAVEGCPEGAMLAVAAAEGVLRPILVQGVELAAVNARSQCSVGGAEDRIEALRGLLDARGLRYRRVPGNRAFHTSMLADAAARFRRDLEGVTLRPPSLPLASNVTGRWLEDREAVDPEYWAGHLHSTVRFASALDRVGEVGRALVEIGPGRSLISFAHQQLGPQPPSTWPSLPGRFDRASELRRLLTSVGGLWQLGVPLDGEAFVADEERARVRLPTYPFEHSQCRLEPSQSSSRLDGRTLRGLGWLSRRGSGPEDRPSRWAVVGDDAGLAAALAPHLHGESGPTRRLLLGDRFEARGPDACCVKPDRWQHFEAALRRFDDDPPDRLLLVSDAAARSDAGSGRGREEHLEALSAVRRAVAALPEARRPDVIVLWEQGPGAWPGLAERIAAAPDAAPIRWQTAVLDVRAAAIDPERLAGQLQRLPPGPLVRIADEATFSPGEQAIQIPPASSGRRESRHGTLILSGPPCDARVDALAAGFARIAWLVPGSHAAALRTSRRQAVEDALARLHSRGAETLLLEFDPGDPETLSRACEQVKSELGELDAACVILDPGAGAAPTGPTRRAVVARCAEHVVELQRALGRTSLQTLTLVAAEAGSTSGAWSVALAQAVALFQPDEPSVRFQALLLAPSAETCPDPRDLAGCGFDVLRIGVTPAARTPASETAAPASGSATFPSSRPHLPNGYEAPATRTERRVARVWQAVLGVEGLGRHDSFHDLGGSSLLAAEVCARLLQDTGVQLDLREFFEGPTIALNADRLDARLAPEARGVQIAPALRGGES